MQGYEIISTPLTNLLKKYALTWDFIAQSSFFELKLKMTQVPILPMPNFSLPFELETDASNYVIRVVLMQQRHPIIFFSKKK